MKLLLHITHVGAQLWQKDQDGWQPQTGTAQGPVWVLTDLAEENFADIQVPRLFGRDRQTFVARQLINRFPDSPYRGLLPTRSSGGLMERLAPPRQTAQGLDAAKRLDAALVELPGPLAGVWLTSLLLATIGAKKGMPSELFVALPSDDGLRLVVLKDRVPVLTRWIPGVTEARALASEIVRTVRHLENTRVLDRSAKPRSVLVLGDAEGMGELLAPDNIFLLDLPAEWAKVAPGEWHFALFDLVIASPVGQVAPLSLRIDFVASRVSRAAYVVAALSLLLAVGGGASHMQEILATQASQQQLQSRVTSQQSKIGAADEALAQFGVSADLVREAAALDLNEIRSLRPLANDLMQLAAIVSRFDALRLQQYTWRLLSTGQVACVSESPGGVAPAPTEGVAPQRLVEVKLAATLPSDQRERARAQMIAALSAQLRSIQGATLMTDPAKALLNAPLQGGGLTPANSAPPSWCFTLPAHPSDEPPKGTTP